ADAITGNYYRPVALTLMALLWQVAGAHAGAWHAIVAVGHGLVTAVLLIVLRTHGLGLETAWFATLLFALHPVHVSSVAWICGLQDVWAALLGVIAYLLHRAWQIRAHRRWLAMSAVVYGVALLSKESSIGLLVMLIGEWLLVPALPAARTRW